MSSQKGNVNKSKPPKHQNKMGFKNSMHDTSKKTKALNDMCKNGMTGVCRKCEDVIQWKIKYKKYKTLTQAKKCTKCHQKAVKLSYTIICAACREAEGVCAKCGVSLPKEEDLNGSSAEPLPHGASATAGEGTMVGKQEEQRTGDGAHSANNLVKDRDCAKDEFKELDTAPEEEAQEMEITSNAKQVSFNDNS